MRAAIPPDSSAFPGVRQCLDAQWLGALIRVASFFCLSAYLLAGALAVPASAQNTSAAQPVMTITEAEDFLKAAGLQTCEITEIDPVVSRFNRAVKAFSIGVAKSCSDYDPGDPTVITVHQFANEEDRDAMVASLHSLRYRALKAYGSVWPVDDFVVVVLGPKRAEIDTMVKAEYQRRHPEQN